MITAGVRTSGFRICWMKNSAQNWPLYHTTPSPITTMLAIATYFRFSPVKASRHGLIAVCPWP